MKLLEKVKVPLDIILIVIVPFTGFLVLFMYLAGLIPAQPIVVEIPGDAVVRQLDEEPAEEPVQAPPAETTTEPVVEQPPAPQPKTETAEQESESLQETVEQVPPSEADKPLIIKDPIDEERMNRVKQIAKVYDQMNASSVAAIVKSMSDKDAVEILSMMNPRNSARVLAALEPDKAARLSLMLTE
jgi:flagellar motility protein MotE (MotC chaperone)